MADLLSPGTLIAGRYLVSDYCNSGGQSFSFIGTDTRAARQWERKVFLKQYLDVPPGSDEARRMPVHFQRFRERLAEKHNYLCLPRDIVDTHNSIVAVFPFLPGKDLQTLMGEGIDDAQCARFAISIANAVRIIHRSGIVHLDLKPDNIIITHDERQNQDFVHLIDLDAATIDGECLRPYLIGTPMYMSPEHICPGKFRSPSEKSDVFTLGIILFQIIFDHHPFDGVENYAQAVLNRDFIVPENEYHKDVVSRIISCLNPDPARRPKSGWVHSTLHNHYLTGFIADNPSNFWVSGFRARELNEHHSGKNNLDGDCEPFIEISSIRNPRFRRRYMDEHTMTDSDFRGAGLSGLSGDVIKFTRECGVWGVRSIMSRGVFVNGRTLVPGVSVAVPHGTKIIIGGDEFFVSVGDFISHSGSLVTRIDTKDEVGKEGATSDRSHFRFRILRLFSLLRG